MGDLSSAVRRVEDLFFLPKLAQVMEGKVPLGQVKAPYPIEDSGGKGLRIMRPKDNSVVSGDFYVDGLTPKPQAAHWVVVHATGQKTYVVQPEVAVREDRTWLVKLSLGATEGVVPGAVIDIRAVANPKQKLAAGDVLYEWPDAEWVSEVVEVNWR